jgi:hypothetical protein
MLIAFLLLLEREKTCLEMPKKYKIYLTNLGTSILNTSTMPA